MDFEKLAKYLGLTLLITSIFTYLYIAYFTLNYRNIYDDHVTWFHVHVIEYLRKNGNPWNDTSLRYVDGRNLFASPVLIDFLISLLNTPLGSWTLFMGIIYLIVVFLLTYMFSRNLLISGFAAQLLAVSPCFSYWFKYNVYGSYTIQPLLLVSLALLGFGVSNRNTRYLLLGSIVGLIVWFLLANGWIMFLLYALFLSAIMFKGVFEKTYLVPATIFIVFSLPLNILLNIPYVTVYHGFSYIALLFIALIYSMILWFSRVLSKNALFSLEIIGTIGVYPLAYYVVALIDLYLGFPGILENYSRIYNPLLDYGVVGLLTLLALVMVIRSRILQDIRARFLEFTLVTSFVVNVILAYNIHVLTVLGIASIIPFTAFALVTVARSLYELSSGRIRVLYTVVALWIIIGSLVSSAIPSYAISSSSPTIYYGDLPREFLRKIRVNESSLIKALDSIKSDVGKKLIISYWGYSYWITGYLGPNTYTLADPSGSEKGWKIISWIFLSDEDTSYSLIKKLVGNRSDLEVYVVVSEIISIQQGEATETGKMADIGAAVIIPPATPEENPVESYRPFGDVYRVLQYIEYGGFNMSYYLTTQIRYYHELPLSWTRNMINTLLVKLIVKGLNQLGYDAVNSIYAEFPIKLEKPRYFQLVNATLVPLYYVNEYGYKYKVYSFTAIYKVNLELGES